MATPTQPPSDTTMENLLHHARDARVEWRDQYENVDHGPSLAPGWNTLSVLDVLKTALLTTASESLENSNEPKPNKVTLTDEDLDAHMPGLKEMVKDVVDSNITSEVLHRALQGEAQYLAMQVIGYMTPEQREALLACAKAKIQE